MRETGQKHIDKNRFKKSHSTVPVDGRLFLACKPHEPTCIATIYIANLTLSSVFKIYKPLLELSEILHYKVFVVGYFYSGDLTSEKDFRSVQEDLSILCMKQKGMYDKEN